MLGSAVCGGSSQPTFPHQLSCSFSPLFPVSLILLDISSVCSPAGMLAQPLPVSSPLLTAPPAGEHLDGALNTAGDNHKETTCSILTHPGHEESPARSRLGDFTTSSQAVGHSPVLVLPGPAAGTHAAQAPCNAVFLSSLQANVT